MEKVILINNVEYVRKDSIPQNVASDPYRIVRGRDSGCFAGFLQSRNGQEVVLTNARRLWYWEGAASLSQLAEEGTSKPKNCKFPVPMKRVTILDAVEIIDVTDKARKSIESVPVWQR
jgi:hypothetical protein